MKLVNGMVVALCATCISACTWVKPMENAQKVAIVNEVHTLSCEKLGQTQSSVKDKLGIVKRRSDKVKQELLTLAQNAALEMGGDTLVALDEPVDGEQTFAVYRCQ